MHARHPLLERRRDNMLALDKLRHFAVGHGGIIPRRDFKPNRDLRSLLYRYVIHESRKCLDNIRTGHLPQEQDKADRTDWDVLWSRHAAILLSSGWVRRG